MKQRYALHVFFLLSLIMAFCAYSAQAQTVRVAIFEDHYSQISATMNTKGCASVDKRVFGDNQMLAEFLLMCNSLKAAGVANFELRPYPIIDRALSALRAGEVDIIGFGVWRDEARAYSLPLTQPVLNNGQFTKGLYTRKSVADRYSYAGTRGFDELIVVANQNWTQDWKALECTGLNLLHVDRYRQMFNLVNKSRAEFLPLTFSSQADLKREVFGIPLYPVKGLKIVIDQSLHFAVGQPNLRTEINKGLAKLHANGTIEQLYSDLGITNPQVKDWQVIGCH